MAAKSSTKSRSAAAKKRAARKAAQRQFKAVVLFAVGLLLFALSIIEGANLWLWFHQTLRGLFSWTSYLLGPCIAYIAVLVSKEKDNKLVTPRAWESAVLILLIAGALQIFAAEQPQGNIIEFIKTLFAQGEVLKGGGVASLVIGVPLYLLFDFWGAAITIVLLIFVFIMVLTGGTLIGFLRGACRPVKRLEEAYLERKENAPPRKFDIDVPLDNEKKTRTIAEKTEESPTQSAKERLLGAAAALNRPITPPQEEPEEQPEQPAELPQPVDEHIEGAQEEEQLPIDDIITRAVSGETVLDAEGYPATQDGRFVFQAPSVGDTLKKPDDQPFVVPPVESAVAKAEPEQKPVYSYPPINLLEEGKSKSGADISEELKSNAQRLVDTLKSFGVQTRVVDISRGPAVTRYELQPSAGVKISKITNLADDIALNLAAAGVRIEAPIPNKAAVGIEVPNKNVHVVTIREVIDSAVFENATSRLTVALGKDIAGNITVADLAKMPHLLIAGSTGSGKSVCINSIIISLLYKASPDEVKLLMVDPKMVELGGYNGIPHLLVPVVTDPKKAAGALCWAVGEMMNRYKTFGDNNVRDITGYNKLAEQTEGMEKMPHVVIIIDELSDLMMVAPNEVEDYICRLAQMARAAGMHLVIATQRPSVDVITGIIKANIPSRIAFAVSSQVDSRTILDMGGAEKLLGRGDMLYYPVGSSKPTRVQGCFVTDKEVERVVAFVKEGEKIDYDSEIMEEIDRQAVTGSKRGGGGGAAASDDEDEFTPQAIECVVEAGIASTSLLQRRLKLGYARAARIMDELEQRGIVGPPEGSKPRQVLISKERWYEMKLNSDM